MTIGEAIAVMRLLAMVGIGDQGTPPASRDDVVYLASRAAARLQVSPPPVPDGWPASAQVVTR